MPKLQIILLCLVFSFSSSILATAVAFHYFLPQNVAVASASPSVPMLAPFGMVAPVSAPMPATLNPAVPAQAAPSRFAAVKNCQDDAAKFCENKDEPASQCLQEHFDEVSSGCHKTLQSMRDAFAPCKDEIAKYCADAGYGGGRMTKCLRKSQEHLSAACMKTVNENPK